MEIEGFVMLFPKFDLSFWGLLAIPGKNSHKGTSVSTSMVGKDVHFWKQLIQK